MYYDDETRRFNFLSGLMLGAALGAGLALVLVPQKRVRTPRPLRRAARTWKTRAAEGVERLRGGARASAAERAGSLFRGGE